MKYFDLKLNESDIRLLRLSIDSYSTKSKKNLVDESLDDDIKQLLKENLIEIHKLSLLFSDILNEKDEIQ